MRLKTQENIKRLELGAVGVSIFAYAVFKWGYAIKNKDFSTLQQMDASQLLIDLPISLFLLDYLTTPRRERKTEDYSEVKELYDGVVLNVSNLMKELHVENDPVKVFAVYEYLYKNGYLSYGKDNNYNVDIKDFSGLQGADVINGNGVCRSYASLLTDIYRNLGIESYNLVVRTDKECIEHSPRLGNYPKKERDLKTKKLVTAVMKFTKNLKISNHVINIVKQEGKVFVLDPTNDAFLQKGDHNLLVLANNSEYGMKKDRFYPTINKAMKVYDHMEIDANVNEMLDKTTISYEEYKDRYLSALKLCDKHQPRFDLFYMENKDLYEKIHNCLNKHNSVIKRMLPIFKKS